MQKIDSEVSDPDQPICFVNIHLGFQGNFTRSFTLHFIEGFAEIAY